jgi:glucosamine kinase
MNYWLGIDGGGTNLRVALVTDDLTVISQVSGETANPSLIGHETAAHRIQSAVREVLSLAHLKPDELAGVGIGIAGSSVAHSESWLRDTLKNIVPAAHVVPSSDMEIALVGALGERHGVLILAGTGSGAYGVNKSGESLQVGGWGYLLGDEGGSYWIGLKILQLLIQSADGRADFPPAFRTELLSTLGLQSEKELIPWLYRSPQPRTREIASLARLVVDAAHEFKPALRICHAAADELASLAQVVMRRLSIENQHIAFAGGLLEHDNIITQRLCSLLELEQHPVALHRPVIGGALLAQLVLKGR